MGRRVKKSAAEMVIYWMEFHDEMFPEGTMTREEFAMEMMGIIDGKKFMAEVKDLVLGRQLTKSVEGIKTLIQERVSQN